MRSKQPSRSEIEAVASWMLDQATKNGAHAADLLYYCSESYGLGLRDGEPEDNTYGVSGGIGIRTIGSDGRQGVAFGNRFDRAALADLVAWSCDNCRNSEPEEGISLYCGHPEEDGSLELFDETIATGISPEERMRRCVEMTKIARSCDPRVVSVRSAAWSDGSDESFYASTAGFAGWKKTTSASCGTAVVLQDGEQFELGSYGKGARYQADLDGALYARLAVERTARILGGKPLPTGKYTLILDPEISASLVDEIGELFCASDVHRGRSLMKGRLGQSVAGNVITLLDDARIPRCLGSGTFDGEGVPTGRTALIDAGIASNYLYNMQYAQKDGVSSTGNASRGLGGLPDVGTSNLVLVPGRESRESLVKNIAEGFLVLELMGLHTLDPVSGDFSLGAKGIYVRNGIESTPVAGVTIAGNLLDLLERVVALGSDHEFFGSTGASTMIVEDVAVAGD